MGYETKGPVVSGGAVVPAPIAGAADLPSGYHDQQAPGHYRLVQGDDGRVFAWAVGPSSWKAEVFPPAQDVWVASPGAANGFEEAGGSSESRPLAIVGARPCELASLGVLDAVLGKGPLADPRYTERRSAMLVVVAECTTPAATCFCASMGTGPEAPGGYDLALTELDDAAGHRFVVRAATGRGEQVLGLLSPPQASSDDLRARERALAGAREAMQRRLDTEGLAELLAGSLDHPRWQEVAERCVACGNCTLVCPTCFCSDVHDISDLNGVTRRRRTWASCFDIDHSYLHSGPVRRSIASRYRQWMTHKLSTWWDQFDTAGCVGCGRCITWCPVGIDLTEEAAAIRGAEGQPP